MKEGKMLLPERERVNFVAGLRPKLMEIADPVQDWLFEKLTREEIFQVLEVGFKYQKRLIDLEIEGLKAQAEVLGEMQKVITGFK